MENALSEWQGEDYLEGTLSREAQADAAANIDRLLEEHDHFMEGMIRHREKREAEAAARQPATDTQAILAKNVSKAKRIPIEQITDDMEKKEEAAQRVAELRPTTLEAARLEQFNGKLPVFHEGKVIEVIDPNQEEEKTKEVRKGTPSRHVHETRTARSRKLRSPAQNPGVRRSSAYDKRPDK